MAKVFCFQCQKESSFQGSLGRREECPHCRADLHVCKNCLHYDMKAYNECKEPQADRVMEKERSNFCDYFSPSAGANNLSSQKDQLRAAADRLFKKNN